eukprot:473880-Hanusia_phi.AAC.1
MQQHCRGARRPRAPGPRTRWLRSSPGLGTRRGARSGHAHLVTVRSRAPCGPGPAAQPAAAAALSLAALSLSHTGGARWPDRPGRCGPAGRWARGRAARPPGPPRLHTPSTVTHTNTHTGSASC